MSFSEDSVTPIATEKPVSFDCHVSLLESFIKYMQGLVKDVPILVACDRCRRKVVRSAMNTWKGKNLCPACVHPAKDAYYRALAKAEAELLMEKEREARKEREAAWREEMRIRNAARESAERIAREREESRKRAFNEILEIATIDSLCSAMRTLNIQAATSRSEVKSAHRRMVKLNHPDRVGERGNVAMRNINSAWEVIRSSAWFSRLPEEKAIRNC